MADFNLALSNIGAILNKYKRIPHSDRELTKVSDSNNISASYRDAKTIEDMLIHSKLPSVNKQISDCTS